MLSRIIPYTGIIFPTILVGGQKIVFSYYPNWKKEARRILLIAACITLPLPPFLNKKISWPCVLGLAIHLYAIYRLYDRPEKSNGGEKPPYEREKKTGGPSNPQVKKIISALGIDYDGGSQMEFNPFWDQDLPEFENDKDLKRLSIQNDFIDSIPDSIGNLSHLEYLAIVGSNIEKLPDTLNSLTQLKKVVIRCHQLEKFPNLEGLKNLEKLIIECDRLEELPPIPEQVKHLVIKCKKLKFLPPLNHLKKLGHLSISSNAITSTGEDYFDGLKNLYYLDIEGAELRYISDPIKNLPNLTHLGLRVDKTKVLLDFTQEIESKGINYVETPIKAT